jgi:hypothetical protein
MRTSRENTGLESACPAASAKVVLPFPWAPLMDTTNIVR